MNRKKSISPGCKEMFLLRGKRILALSIGLLFTIQAGATVDGKLFSISKKLELRNINVHLAVNSITGDVVAVWEQRHPGNVNYGRIYAARCKARKKGKFSIKRARLISDPAIISSDADVAYSLPDDAFYSAWQGWYYSALHGSDLPDVEGRKLNTRAIPSSPIIAIAATDHLEMTPLIVSTSGASMAGAAAPAGSYLMVFDYAPESYDDLEQGDPGSGLYGLFIDASGVPTCASPFLISHAAKDLGDFYAGRSWATDLIRTDKRLYILSAVRVTFTAFRAPYLFLLGRNGRLKEEQSFAYDNSYSFGAAQLGPDLFMAGWDRIVGSVCKSFVRFFDSHLTLDVVTMPLPGKDAWPVKVVQLKDDPGACLLVGNNKTLYAIRVSAGGEFSGAMTLLFKFNNKLEDFDAVCLPGSNRIFIAWSKKKGRNAEVMGFTFDAGILP